MRAKNLKLMLDTTLLSHNVDVGISTNPMINHC